MDATSGIRAVERVKCHSTGVMILKRVSGAAKNRYGLQIISELEMERLRLFHFFSMTNHIIAKNSPGSSVSLSPTNLNVLTATDKDFERCFIQCVIIQSCVSLFSTLMLHPLKVVPRALAARGGEFAAVSLRFAEMSWYGRGELLGRQYFYLSRPEFLGITVGAFRLFMASSDAPKYAQQSFRNLGGGSGSVIDRGSSQLNLSLMLSNASIEHLNGPSHLSLFYLTRKHTTR